VALGKLITITLDNYSKLENFKLPELSPINTLKCEKLPDYFSYLSFPFNSNEGIPWAKWVVPEIVIKTVDGKMFIRLNSNGHNPHSESLLSRLISGIVPKTQSENESFDSNVIVTAVFDETLKDFSDKVNKLKSKITSGFLTKGVMSRKRTINFEGKFDFINAVDKLAEKYRECTILLTNYSNHLFLAATPETLFNLEGGCLTTEAVAGSIKSSDKLQEQLLNEDRLLHSAKNLEEHFIVRDFIVNNLKSIAPEVLFDHKPGTRKLKNVTHLVTNVSAKLPRNISPVDLIKLLFPTPALCGSPKLEAASIINEIEGEPRDLYGGVFGYITNGGLSEYFVAIRCGFIFKDHALLYAGGGIVANSDPEDEYAETEMKFTPLSSLFTDEI
jgi:menaquinone-specific isochorismate synthase